MSKAWSKGKFAGFQQPCDVFQGYGGCWEWGRKKAHCPSRSRNSDKMDVRAVQSTAIFGAASHATSQTLRTASYVMVAGHAVCVTN